MAVFEFLNTAALVRCSVALIVTILKGTAFLDKVFRPGGGRCLATGRDFIEVIEVLVRGSVGPSGPSAAAGHGAGGVAEAEQEQAEGSFHPARWGSSEGYGYIS